MIANFLFSISRVAPIFLTIALGYLLRRIRVVDSEFVTQANRLVFFAALPVSLFATVARADTSNLPGIGPLIYAPIATFVGYFLTFIISDRVLSRKALVGTFVQGANRGNIALIGLPLAISFAGDAGAAGASILVTVLVPFYNICSVIALSLRSYNSEKTSFGQVLKKVVTNPLFLGIMCGIPFCLFQVRFPYFLDESLNYIQSMTTPLALLVIGGSFQFQGFANCWKEALSAGLIKTLLFPTTALLIAYLLGFRGLDLMILLIGFGAPTAINSYANAIHNSGDGILASSIIVVSTALSAITLTLGFFLYIQYVQFLA